MPGGLEPARYSEKIIDELIKRREMSYVMQIK